MIHYIPIVLQGSAFPIVLLVTFAQKPDTRLGLMQTFEDLFKSSVDDKSFEDDILPVNYQMGIPEVQNFIARCLHAGYPNLSSDAEILQSFLIGSCPLALLLKVSYNKIASIMT